MDHERLAGLARRADVAAEALALPLEIAFEPVVVEPRLADGDDLRRGGHRDEVRDRGLRRVRVVRMHADGRVQVGVRVRDRDHCGHAGKFDADAQRVRDRVLAHRVEQRRQVGRELREIEVTVGVDEHRNQRSVTGIAAELRAAIDRRQHRDANGARCAASVDH